MSDERWSRAAELGSVHSLRVVAWALRWLPRRAALWIVDFSAYYYSRRRGPNWQASRGYLERIARTPEGAAALGVAATPQDSAPLRGRVGDALVRRHFREFALGLYDRILVWGGALESMRLEHDGSGDAFDLAKTGRGALLLGAHLGNIDMLWLVSKRYRLPINVVAFFDNAAIINEFLESLDPERNLRVIELDPDSVRAAFEIRACLERGELVVILADRVPPGRGRVAEATFLGGTARFPLAPFLLGVTLGCPVMFPLCVRTGDASYRTLLRSLSPGQRAPRDERDKAARELLERYVGLLEEWCLRHPLQWFNFFEFWQEGGDA